MAFLKNYYCDTPVTLALGNTGAFWQSPNYSLSDGSQVSRFLKRLENNYYFEPTFTLFVELHLLFLNEIEFKRNTTKKLFKISKR